MNTLNTTRIGPRPTLLSSLRALPRPAWILFLGMFLNKFGGFVVPFLTLYLTNQGYSLAETSIAIGAYGVGNLAASVLGGHLADQLGRRQTIILSMFSGAVLMMLLSQMHHLTGIVLLTALTGLAGECYRPASSALLTDVVPSSERVTAFAALRVSFNAGFAFGPAMAGFIAGYGYFWLFAGNATAFILFGVVALFALPRGVHVSRQSAGWNEVWRVIRRDKPFQQLLLSNFCIALVFFQMLSAYGLYVTQCGFSAATYGVLFSLNGIMVVLCELPLTTVTRRFPARRVMAAGYVVAGAGFALNAFAHSVPALVACMIVFTLGEIMTLPVSSAYIAELSPPHMRGRYMGISGLTWAVAFIVGPGLGMNLLSLHPAALWFSSGALGILAAVVISPTAKTRL